VSNRVTLAQLAKMTTEEVNTLPLDQLAMLLEDVAALVAEAKAYGKTLSETLNVRFASQAALLRRAKGTDVGTVTITTDGFRVKADLPKKVDWDQAELRRAIDMIRSWGENPDDYVSVEIKVSETKYNAWPPAIQKLFTPARTLSAGTPSYKLEPMKEAV
jgi:hypothetical protein